MLWPGAAIEASRQAEAALAARRSEVQRALVLELEAARYEAQRAQRQYDAVDPEKRLVAAELEARWNDALERVDGLIRRIELARAGQGQTGSGACTTDLDALRANLADVWNDPEIEMGIKKRIARSLIEEVIADLDDATRHIVIVIHWKGGVHTELRVPRRRRAEHGRTTSTDTVEAICTLARVCTDGVIAAALNRSGVKTATGLVWNTARVCALRKSRHTPAYSTTRQQEEGWLKLGEAATYLGVTQLTVRRAIEKNQLPALHPLSHGPWIIQRQDLDSEPVAQLFARIRTRRDEGGLLHSNQQTSMFPER